MTRLFILLLVCSTTVYGQKQKQKNPNPDPVKAWYGMEAYEFIFSKGEVKAGAQTLDNIVRFTGFFNGQSQRHYNFSNHFGMITGIGIRNVGLLNKYDLPDGKFEMKNRAYSIGVPLAFKLGGMVNGNYIAFGAEAEYMFQYKRKIWYNRNDTKTSEWFSNEVNGFNPSLFADIRFHNGTFFRFKYYLNDFLSDKSTTFYLPDSNIPVTLNPEKSTMWYISIGSAFKLSFILQSEGKHLFLTRKLSSCVFPAKKRNQWLPWFDDRLFSHCCFPADNRSFCVDTS
jgi:hypothetical protein